MTDTQTSVSTPDSVTTGLSTLDRFLPVWIGMAMGGGLLLGRLVPGLGSALSAVEVEGISLPIAIGLLVMMYPVLAKVRYDRLDEVTADRKLMVSSLLLNWIIGPAVMFALAWLLLADLPEYRTGLIIVGLARCIAMVIVWNDLARGDCEAAAVLVALNSLFQVVMFGALGWFYLSVLPGWLGPPKTGIDVSPWQIAKSVLIFLGIPLSAGYLSRRLGGSQPWRSGLRPDPFQQAGAGLPRWICRAATPAFAILRPVASGAPEEGGRRANAGASTRPEEATITMGGLVSRRGWVGLVGGETPGCQTLCLFVSLEDLYQTRLDRRSKPIGDLRRDEQECDTSVAL